jgi:hypothetical protein
MASGQALRTEPAPLSAREAGRAVAREITLRRAERACRPHAHLVMAAPRHARGTISASAARRLAHDCRTKIKT